MNKRPLINIHTHIFNSKCAPPTFLKTQNLKVTRRFPETMMSVLETGFVRRSLKWISKTFVNSRAEQKMQYRMIAFLDIGLAETQEKILDQELEAARQFDNNARTVVLTLNMDYIDDCLPPMPYSTQIEDIMRMKRQRPDEVFPFLSIDPRHLSGTDGLNWVKPKFETGEIKDNVIYPYFSGLKLYPALGYFPFDKRMDEIFAYAEKYQIPVMTHCTRVGSLYIGPSIESLIPYNIASLLSAGLVQSVAVTTAIVEIQKRIADYYAHEGWIKNSKKGDNDKACDLFSHPQNYVLLMEKYPKLKLCLAHMGGDTEMKIIDDDADGSYARNIDKPMWFERIKSMMIQYPNMYTDISYTLSALGHADILFKLLDLFKTADIQGQPLVNRVLFGTDFYMTQKEDKEYDLISLAREKLAPYWEQLTITNNYNYLGVWAGQELPDSKPTIA